MPYLMDMSLIGRTIERDEHVRQMDAQTTLIIYTCKIDTFRVNGLEFWNSGIRSGISGLTPKCRYRHLVAYEWKWTGLNNRGRPDFIQDFKGSLVGNLCTTSNWKISLGCVPLSIRMNFAKKTDDHVVYFLKIDFIC
jgi:hypothetical protein